MNIDDFLPRFANELQVDSAGITGETVLADLPEYDSMARLALMAMINSAYGAPVNADDLAECATVGDLVALVERKKAGS